MYCIRVVIIFILTTCVRSANVGSTIFYKRKLRSECFTLDDVARLRARQMFEEAMPDVASTDKVDKKYVKETIRFFRQALREVDKDFDQHTAYILKEALTDTIGGFMRSRFLPTVRFAYYAGFIPCRTARHAQDFFEELKTDLNTRGLGWAEPEIPNHANLSVVKVTIGTGKFYDSCVSLISKRDKDSCIHLPPPKLDDVEKPAAIALPFKNNGFISLSSPSAENILLKYYTTASRCILGRSPEKCRHADFVTFNNEMWHWMKRDVAPHLVDEKLYCAYGGVLRIAAAVQSYGKGLARRNLFKQDTCEKWKPWRRLGDSCIKLDMDWTPTLYILAVIAAATAICFLQTMYIFIFSKRGCMCKGTEKQIFDANDPTYAQVDSNIPAMLNEHAQSTIYYTDDRRQIKKGSSKTRSNSLGSIKTQKVYDLNDNTEKMMDVIMSGNEDSDVSSQSTPASNRSRQESEESRASVTTKRSGQSTARSKSPPKLETPISQLKLDSPQRAEKKKPRRPMYTSSATTRSDVTMRYCTNQDGSESSWSDSSMTHCSASSASFKSQSFQSNSTRDLAWARRIISKHSEQTQTKSTTDTDFAINSFTTAPSRK